MKLIKQKKYQAPQVVRAQLGLEDLLCEGIVTTSYTTEVDETRNVNATVLPEGETYEPSYIEF